MPSYSLCRHAGIVRDMRTAYLGISIFLAALALSGCQRDDALGPAKNGAAKGEAAPGVQMGIYRAVLTLPGGDLPFGLELAKEGSATIGYLVNGQERLKLTEIKITGPHLEIRMPGYENVLTADAAGNQLQGDVLLIKPHDKNQHIPLHATYGVTYRFFKTPPADVKDLSGRWAAKFVDDAGASENLIGEF